MLPAPNHFHVPTPLSLSPSPSNWLLASSPCPYFKLLRQFLEHFFMQTFTDVNLWTSDFDVDCCRGVSGRHQQHFELRRSAKLIWGWRIRAQHYRVSTSGQGGWNCRRKSRCYLWFLYQQSPVGYCNLFVNLFITSFTLCLSYQITHDTMSSTSHLNDA